MKKKTTAMVLLLGLILTGCNSATSALVESQNSEVVALQMARREILARPANTPKEMARKNADLKMINAQIHETQLAQHRAQDINDRKINNIVKGTITGVGAVLGTAAVIHNITK